MSVPYTRTLPYVLRDQLDEKGGAKFSIAKVTAIPDGEHVTISEGEGEATIPRVSSYSPTVGEPAYCLVADTIMVAVGTVGGKDPVMSGSGPPAAGTGGNGSIYIDTATGRFYGPKSGGAWPASPFGRLMPMQPTYAQLHQG